uniref:Chromosome 1 open reading frame 216 n=1 Tax=Pseudonaja textilis TaxID=8673 RepID=A0A670XZS0_PSETE
MCQPEFRLHPQLGEAQGNSQQDVIYRNKKDSHPDKNLNFMNEKSYDSNENWSQPISKASISQKLSEDNFLGLGQKKREEEDIRRPPEGSEFRSPEQETKYQVKVKKKGSLVSSPLEDKGYSSSRWTDSPESDGTNVWKIPSTFSPALAEAFRNVQEKKKLKELEKQKYQTHLVMYRRLALLRWIRSLQEKVADQQNRLQESFDIILDNRKELIRQGSSVPLFDNHPKRPNFCSS